MSKIHAAICDLPSESHVPILRRMTLICAIITHGSVILRLLSRYLFVHSFGMDDGFIVAAAVSFETLSWGTHLMNGFRLRMQYSHPMESSVSVHKSFAFNTNYTTIIRYLVANYGLGKHLRDINLEALPYLFQACTFPLVAATSTILMLEKSTSTNLCIF